MYIPKFFEAYELVPPEVYAERGDRSFELIDDRVLITLDALRTKFGPIIINNYMWGGHRKWSGLRTPGSPDYRDYSQHTFGRAMDCLFADISVEAVRQYLIDHPEEFPYITAFEKDVNWLHFDVRNAERYLIF